MEFRNLTPFSALCFPSLGVADRRFLTIVARVAYRIVAQPNGGVALKLFDEAPVPLELADRYEGAPNASVLIAESDLAPFKPACDVLVRAHAHAPRGQASTQFPVRLRVTRADAQPPIPAPHAHVVDDDSWAIDAPADFKRGWQPKPVRATEVLPKQSTLIDKTLIVTGERYFERDEGWALSPPEPFKCLPLGYAHAYGGECRIDLGDPAAARVPSRHHLSPSQQGQHPDANALRHQQALAHTSCAANPIGRGFAEAWFVDATRLQRITAPRVEYPQNLVDQAFFKQQLKLTDTDRAQAKVAGFGPMGRSWLPRLSLAGTHDARWLAEQHPSLPMDADMRYWNCAPPDQQIAYPSSSDRFCVQLQNLVRHDTPGSTRDRAGNTLLEFDLPRDRALLLTRWDKGALLPIPMRIDTLSIDLLESRVDIVWRLRLPLHAPIRAMDLRFKVHANNSRTERSAVHG